MADTITKLGDGLLAVEMAGATMIVTPQADVPELVFPEIEGAGKRALALLLGSTARNVVVDLRHMRYTGSTALGLLIRLWKVVLGRGGVMAFCNVSKDEKEILRVTNLDRCWPVHPSREEAMAAVHPSPHKPA